MAGYHDQQRIARTCAADGTRALEHAQLRSKLTIGARLSVWNIQKRLPDTLFKRRAMHGQRKGKRLSPAGKVLFKRPSSLLKQRRGLRRRLIAWIHPANPADSPIILHKQKPPDGTVICDLPYIGQIDPRFEHLKETTVFDVLCYRACLQTPGRIDAATDREEGLRRLFSVTVAPMPAVRIYSDINAMVIKYVVETKTGMALYDALKAYVFDPAGMKETWSRVPESALDRCLNYNYEHRIVRDVFTLRTDIAMGRPHDPKAALLCDDGRDLCGHAGLFSTRQDMVRFSQALLGGELLTQASLLEMSTNRTGQYHPDGTYRQPMGFLCFTKHPLQRLSEVPAHMSAHGFGISGFTGNHLVLDPVQRTFTLFLGNRCHMRVSHITPPEGRDFADYGLDSRGAGLVRWNDGRTLPTSARYVYLKDACLHEPIVQRMHALGWLA